MSESVGRAAPVAPRYSYPVDPLVSKYLGKLEKWGKERGYDITDVSKRFEKWFSDKDPEKTLDLSGLDLDSMPPLPKGVKYLDISKNQASCVPEEWPAGLCSLKLSGEQLAQLLQDREKFPATFFNNLEKKDVVQFSLAATPLAEQLKELIKEATDPSKNYQGPRIDIHIDPDMQDDANPKHEVKIT